MKSLKLLYVCLFSFALFGSLFVTNVRADQDETDDEGTDAGEGETYNEGTTEQEDPDMDAPKINKSPDAETSVLFVQPAIALTSVELPAGKLVEIVVGFHNKGQQDFILETLDASLRYPMDHNYYMQNFTTLPLDYTVKPSQHGSVLYYFLPADAFAGRTFGLSINLAYRDLSGNYFVDPVFNQTIPLIEVDEGLDGETIFLYIFMVGIAGILVVVGLHFLQWGKKKTIGTSKSSKSSAVETGTKKSDDVDFDWIPKETIQDMKRSPKTPTRSPRARKVKSGSASATDSP